MFKKYRERKLREKCLELALRNTTYSDALKTAFLYETYLKGGSVSDIKSVSEIVYAKNSF